MHYFSSKGKGWIYTHFFSREGIPLTQCSQCPLKETHFHISLQNLGPEQDCECWEGAVCNLLCTGPVLMLPQVSSAVWGATALWAHACLAAQQTSVLPSWALLFGISSRPIIFLQAYFSSELKWGSIFALVSKSQQGYRLEYCCTEFLCKWLQSGLLLSFEVADTTTTHGSLTENTLLCKYPIIAVRSRGSY